MHHGRHANLEITAPKSPFYQGPFGRLFRNLPAWTPAGITTSLEEHLLAISKNEMIEDPDPTVTPTDIASDPARIQQLENQFGSQIPAAYTYFGQFVDHDITFDPASSLMRQNDPAGLLNHRTPRLDLDNVYGGGPSGNPYLYDQSNPGKFLIGQVAGTNLRDLPRNVQGRALIGDMRNDENSIVAQIQLAFLLAHNTLVDRAGGDFDTARRVLRWLYQHIVWNDFLKRIMDPGIHACAGKLERICGGVLVPEIGLDPIYSWKNQPYMPVEFSVAAYRFGHSMVRNSYQTNQPHRGFGNFAPIFDNTSGGAPDDLRGFRPLPQENYVQWDWFLEMTTSSGPFPQMSRKIDTKLSNALFALHEDIPGSNLNNLAFRNLMRGISFGLPSGSAVARRLGLTPMTIAQDHDSLWFYILKEAENLPGSDAGEQLGEVGSIIVCSVFAGLLQGDPNSFINIDPAWSPDSEPLLDATTDRVDSTDWTLASIIRLAGLPVDSNDVSNQT